MLGGNIIIRRTLLAQDPHLLLNIWKYPTEYAVRRIRQTVNQSLPFINAKINAMLRLCVFPGARLAFGTNAASRHHNKLLKANAFLVQPRDRLAHFGENISPQGKLKDRAHSPSVVKVESLNKRILTAIGGAPEGSYVWIAFIAHDFGRDFLKHIPIGKTIQSDFHKVSTHGQTPSKWRLVHTCADAESWPGTLAQAVSESDATPPT